MKKLLSILLSSLTVLLPASAVTITPSNDGIHVIGNSDLLKFTIDYPIFVSADNKTTLKNTQADVKDNTVTLTYAGGGQITLSIDPNGGIELTGTSMPANANHVQLHMLIDFAFKDGGQYQPGDKPAQPFPQDKSAKPHLFQGTADSMTIRSSDGKGIIITTPKYSYQEVTDNRAWNWDMFQYMTQTNYPGDGIKLDYVIADAPDAPAPTPAPGTP